MGHYATAQVCLNGHAITGDISLSEGLEKFCSTCGAKTITACPSCHAPIRGKYVEPSVFFLSSYTSPAYCHECGKPFPWTESALSAATELVEDMEELNGDDQEKFKKSIMDIAFESPRTSLAANRIAKYLRRVTPATQEAFKTIMYGIATEAAKRLIWPIP